MLAHELITDEIPPLKPSETAMKALRWMDEFKVTHLPLVEKVNFLGMISEADLLDLDSPDTPLGKLELPLINTFVYDDKHVFEVIKVVSDHHLTVIPVLNKDQKYIGAISIAQLMRVIAAMPVVEGPGGIVIIELNVNDYTLSEIARIVEGNDAKIMGTFITSHPDSTKMQLTLKINQTDLSGILQTFDRYDYHVTASYDQSDIKEDLKERYDSLMNYLNM